VSFLPFEPKLESSSCERICLSRCQIREKMPVDLQEQCKKSQYLLRYLCGIPLDTIGIPKYLKKLERSMKGMKNPNLLYSVDKEMFIHIMANRQDIRDYYIPIEPNCYLELDNFLEEIETRMADSVEEFEDISETSKRIEAMFKLMDRMVIVHENANKPANHAKDRNDSGSFSSNRKINKRIVLTPAQYNGLRYLIRRKVDGLGVLEPMIRDPYLEDISCSGLGPIFAEHRIFGGLRTSIGFDTHDSLDKFVIELAENIKHPVTFRNPCVDATLADGSRINIVFGTDVSKRGSNFTIRKFSPTPMSIIELIQSGALNYEMAAYLSLIIQEQMNIFIAGETASGKTTLLNAITTFIPPESKVVSIEDTPEVQVPHPNWIRGVTRGSAKTAEASDISMFDLLKAALRQRPNFIIIGEIRGEEGAIAFQAMQSGHACMSTFHAASVTKLIQRLTGNPINVPKAYVDNLNLVIITQMVRLPNGLPARRVTNISEIVGYDSVSGTFSYIDSFNWRPLDDTFLFKGNMNSYLLEERIAPKRGLPPEKRQQIYAKVKQRAEILKRIYAQKITSFQDVHQVLSKAYRDGYFR